MDATEVSGGTLTLAKLCEVLHRKRARDVRRATRRMAYTLVSDPEARAILDAFRVGHRTEANRYAGHMKGYNVWSRKPRTRTLQAKPLQGRTSKAYG